MSRALCLAAAVVLLALLLAREHKKRRTLEGFYWADWVEHTERENYRRHRARGY